MHASVTLLARGKGKTIPIKVSPLLCTCVRYVQYWDVQPLTLQKLLSSVGTGFFYTTRKNVAKVPEKMKMIKFDPVVRRRVLFTEHKIK